MPRVYEKLFLVLTLVLIWLAISSASILVILSGATPEACAFWRLLLSIPLIYLLSFLAHRQKPFLTRLGLHNFIAGVALSFHFILWMNSLFLIPVFISTLLVTLYPLYSLILESAIFKRRIKLHQLIGILTSTILLSIYLRVNELILNLGTIEALIAGFLAGIYFVTGHFARRYLKESVFDYSIKTYLVASAITLLYSLIYDKKIIYYDVKPYLYFAMLATIPMILGHTLMNYLLDRYPASLITMVSYGEPFGAALLAHLILNQHLSINHLIYGFLIITCVFLTVTLSTDKETIYEKTREINKRR